jgi:hypothetical protein
MSRMPKPDDPSTRSRWKQPPAGPDVEAIDVVATLLDRVQDLAEEIVRCGDDRPRCVKLAKEIRTVIVETKVAMLQLPRAR